MFSGGKDSFAALLKLQQDPTRRVERLITTFSNSSATVALHGTPISVLRRQAELLGLPLIEIGLPDDCDNETYLARVADALAPLASTGIRHIAFGDLYLDDIRRFRERQMESLEMTPLFPLWHADTAALASGMIDAGLKALICGVDREKLSPDFLGRLWDHAFLAGLPEGVDPCGENGEFHTLVVDAPNMRAPLGVAPGEVLVSHDRYCMLAYRPA